MKQIASFVVNVAIALGIALQPISAVAENRQQTESDTNRVSSVSITPQVLRKNAPNSSLNPLNSPIEATALMTATESRPAGPSLIDSAPSVSTTTDSSISTQQAPVQIESGVSAMYVLNHQEVTLTLSLNALTDTNGLSVATYIPDGLEYASPTKTDEVFDATSHRVSMHGVNAVKGRKQSRTYRLRVDVPTVPTNLVLSTTLTTSDNQQNVIQTVIQVADQRVSAPVQAASGGKVRISDRIELNFTAGALEKDSEVSSMAFAPLTLPGKNPGAPTIKITLGPEMTFKAPVTVTADIKGLYSAELLDHLGVFPTLQYLRVETITHSVGDFGTEPITVTTVQAVNVPSTYDPKTGLLQAQVTHFSNYQVSLPEQPIDPQPWMLKPNGGDVSLFRGSVNYKQTINIPAMLDGLQPNLSLDYSSAAADTKFDQKYTPGESLSAGAGWSFDIPKITRLTRQKWECYGTIDSNHNCSVGYAYAGSYRNDFTLSLDGQTYYLQTKSDEGTDNGGEYVTESYSPLRILRCTARYTSSRNALCDMATTNGTSEYWQVWTPDGTRYVFGIDASSTNLTVMTKPDGTVYNSSNNAYMGYAGEGQNGNIARVWFLRYVYAAKRDSVSSGKWSVQYNYVSGETNNIYANFNGCGGGGCFGLYAQDFTTPDVCKLTLLM